MPQPDSGDNCCDCPSRSSPCGDCGGPPFNTGACCVGNACSILTSEECFANSGTYLGDGTDCLGIDCTAVPQLGCCGCPDLGESCEGNYCCTILSTDCHAPCSFTAGFGGFGPSFCCPESGAPGLGCAVCIYWPEELATHCCPLYVPAGDYYCCRNGYTCCGQGDSQCCNDLTEICCDVDPELKYCCPIAGFECCGFDGCCPAGFCIDGSCTA